MTPTETMTPTFHSELATLGRGRVRPCEGKNAEHGLEILTGNGYEFLGNCSGLEEARRALKLIRAMVDNVIHCERERMRKDRR